MPIVDHQDAIVEAFHRYPAPETARGIFASLNQGFGLLTCANHRADHTVNTASRIFMRCAGWFQGHAPQE